MGDAGGVSGPTGTTVDRRGSDPEAGLSGSVCEDAVEYWALERKAVAEDDEEEEEDIGRSEVWPVREDGSDQGAGAQSEYSLLIREES